jgi:hypothetical protein
MFFTADPQGIAGIEALQLFAYYTVSDSAGRPFTSTAAADTTTAF